MVRYLPLILLGHRKFNAGTDIRHTFNLLMEIVSYFLGIRSVIKSDFCPNGHSGPLQPGPCSSFNALELRTSLSSELLWGLAGAGERNTGKHFLFSPQSQFGKWEHSKTYPEDTINNNLKGVWKLKLSASFLAPVNSHFLCHLPFEIRNFHYKIISYCTEG